MNDVAVKNVSEISNEDILINILQAQKDFKQRQSVLEQDVDYLKNESPINPSTSLMLEQKRKRRVISLLGGKDSLAYQDSRFARSVFAQAARDFKEYFRVSRYDLLRRKDEEAAFDYWDNWEPNVNTKLMIKTMNQGLMSVG